MAPYRTEPRALPNLNPPLVLMEIERVSQHAVFPSAHPIQYLWNTSNMSEIGKCLDMLTAPSVFKDSHSFKNYPLYMLLN